MHKSPSMSEIKMDEEENNQKLFKSYNYDANSHHNDNKI
jgi:hypothetical protein